MVRCPVCESARIVVVVSPERRAFCTSCGARWIQDGAIQRAVQQETPPSLKKAAGASEDVDISI